MPEGSPIAALLKIWTMISKTKSQFFNAFHPLQSLKFSAAGAIPARVALVWCFSWVAISPAAVVAGAGWYLLEPPAQPRISKGEEKIFAITDAPLSQWEHVRSYDKAADCEKAKKDRSASALRDTEDKQYADQKDTFILLYIEASNSRCVASDDPRLLGQ